MFSKTKTSGKRIMTRVFAMVLMVAMFVGTLLAGGYIDTNSDTRPDPEKVEYTLKEYNKDELLYETDTVKYLYREDRDIIAIVDKRSGYTWKTGIDVPFSKELKNNLNNIRWIRVCIN